METDRSITSGKSSLPIEIVLLVIESLVPQNDKAQPILYTSHPTAQLLLSFTRVSEATYPTACKLLWQNCLYIDTKSKLRRFRRFLSQKSPITGQTLCEAYGSARLYLNPLHYRSDTASAFETFSLPSSPLDVDLDNDLPDDCSDAWTDISSNRSQIIRFHAAPEPPRSGSPVDVAYSQYSTHDWKDKPMQDLQTIHILKDVLLTLAPVLKTLIVDMPLTTLNPFKHIRFVKPLRQAFEALVNIEELISVKDELYISTEASLSPSQPEVWSLWPKLRRLCLYNVLVDEHLWRNMASCPQLETALFIRQDPNEEDLSKDDIKGAWAGAWATANSQATSDGELVYQGPEITIAFGNWPPGLPDFSHMLPDWQKIDPCNKINVLNVATHAKNDRRARERGPIASCQDWMRDKALGDTLWTEVKVNGWAPFTPMIFEDGLVDEDGNMWTDEIDESPWFDGDKRLWL
ncbi:hypothetical protein FBEOM_9606 [Fusarium beomiforme]|uniref:Uncharacterized protein n=1 Tax=Fusarium beomiforme TaxID=44412 RepID=A0A9P5ACW8_9HYPO|nr:hypothetical protein FBEOM_9606 [Fusarium beomiforme]